ncbi:MAG: o-succinylbenzoate--CoA ligase [Pseudonocardiaceae bacterium]
MLVIHCDGSPTAVGELDDAMRGVLSGRAALAVLGPEREPGAEPGAGAGAGAGAGPGRAVLPGDPGPGQLVIATSGSAGQPKWVQLGAAALRASATATQSRLGGPGRWLLALPAQHIAGLQVLVRAALAGTRAEVLDLRGGFDPASFAATARRLTGRCYTALVPTQLARVLDAAPRALTGFDAVLVGGAATPAAVVQRARAAGVRVMTTYGMTETAGGCVYDGRPLDGAQVRIAGLDVGRIELAGPMLATGYLNAPAETAAAFRDGWFRTSDLGRLDTHGRLHVLGRADDVIVTGGINVAPAEVEAVLTALPGVRAACVVGLPDPEWGERIAAAVVPADPARPPDPGALHAAARCLLTGAQTPKEIVLLDALPLRGVGKPDRRAIRALLSAPVDNP